MKKMVLSVLVVGLFFIIAPSLMAQSMEVLHPNEQVEKVLTTDDGMAQRFKQDMDKRVREIQRRLRDTKKVVTNSTLPQSRIRIILELADAYRPPSGDYLVDVAVATGKLELMKGHDTVSAVGRQLLERYIEIVEAEARATTPHEVWEEMVRRKMIPRDERLINQIERAQGATALVSQLEEMREKAVEARVSEAAQAVRQAADAEGKVFSDINEHFPAKNEALTTQQQAEAVINVDGVINNPDDVTIEERARQVQQRLIKETSITVRTLPQTRIQVILGFADSLFLPGQGVVKVSLAVGYFDVSRGAEAVIAVGHQLMEHYVDMVSKELDSQDPVKISAEMIRRKMSPAQNESGLTLEWSVRSIQQSRGMTRAMSSLASRWLKGSRPSDAEGAPRAAGEGSSFRLAHADGALIDVTQMTVAEQIELVHTAYKITITTAGASAVLDLRQGATIVCVFLKERGYVLPGGPFTESNVESILRTLDPQTTLFKPLQTSADVSLPSEVLAEVVPLVEGRYISTVYNDLSHENARVSPNDVRNELIRRGLIPEASMPSTAQIIAAIVPVGSIGDGINVKFQLPLPVEGAKHNMTNDTAFGQIEYLNARHFVNWHNPNIALGFRDADGNINIELKARVARLMLTSLQQNLYQFWNMNPQVADVRALLENLDMVASPQESKTEADRAVRSMREAMRALKRSIVRRAFWTMKMSAEQIAELISYKGRDFTIKLEIAREGLIKIYQNEFDYRYVERVIDSFAANAPTEILALSTAFGELKAAGASPQNFGSTNKLTCTNQAHRLIVVLRELPPSQVTGNETGLIFDYLKSRIQYAEGGVIISLDAFRKLEYKATANGLRVKSKSLKSSLNDMQLIAIQGRWDRLKAVGSKAATVLRVLIAEEVAGQWFSVLHDKPEELARFHQNLVQHPVQMLGSIGGFIATERGTQIALKNAEWAKLKNFPRVFNFIKAIEADLPIAAAVIVMGILRKIINNADALRQYNEAERLEKAMFEVRINNMIIQGIMLYVNAVGATVVDGSTYTGIARVGTELIIAGRSARWLRSARYGIHLLAEGSRARSMAEMASGAIPVVIADLTVIFIIQRYLDWALEGIIHFWTKWDLQSEVKDARSTLENLLDWEHHTQYHVETAYKNVDKAREKYEQFLTTSMDQALIKGELAVEDIQAVYGDRLHKLKTYQANPVYGSYEVHAYTAGGGASIPRNGMLTESYQKTDSGWKVTRRPIDNSGPGRSYWGGSITFSTETMMLTPDEFDAHIASRIETETRQRDTEIAHVRENAFEASKALAQDLLSEDGDLTQFRREQIEFLESLNI